MFCKPQFYGVREAASNIGNGIGNYTAEMFQDDFPQFFTRPTEEAPAVSLLPGTMLAEFIRQANAAIQPAKWQDGWRYLKVADAVEKIYLTVEVS